MKFRTIVADPPWSYRNKNVGDSGTSGSAYKYNNMSLDEIADLPVPSIVDKEQGACCYLWVPVPLLDDGIEVLKAWGFKYKTSIFWRKLYPGKRMGMGWWYRGHIELALFGICGPIKAFRSSIKNVFAAPVEKHSQKPDAFCEFMVEPVAPKPWLELFATRERKDWSVWGNDMISAKSYVDIFG